MHGRDFCRGNPGVGGPMATTVGRIAPGQMPRAAHGPEAPATPRQAPGGGPRPRGPGDPAAGPRGRSTALRPRDSASFDRRSRPAPRQPSHLGPDSRGAEAVTNGKACDQQTFRVARIGSPVHPGCRGGRRTVERARTGSSLLSWDENRAAGPSGRRAAGAGDSCRTGRRAGDRPRPPASARPPGPRDPGRGTTPATPATPATP